MVNALMNRDMVKQLRALIGRDSVRLALRMLLRWPRDSPLESGYSIILGVPWHLRHLTSVNLECIARTDRSNLRQIHVVLDRVAPVQLDEIRASLPSHLLELPLLFHCYSGVAGRIVEMADVSTFYNGMNCITALQQMATKHAVLHDFDLYPVVPHYFERIYRQMLEHDLHFCGVETTRFDGLLDSDLVLGTWGLGMDVEWLRRRFAPADILHRIRTIRGRPVSLDPFSDIQFTHCAQRELVEGLQPDDFCHVKNLCSSYLRFKTGRPVKLAWRLHYLWYLEHIHCGRDLAPITQAMNEATDLALLVDGQMIDFFGTDPTCANVLDAELSRMDQFLFDSIRPQVRSYLDASRRFLEHRNTRGRSDGTPSA
jgi:hypothetical protein